MTRALVIGGTGYVGQAACKELMRRGVETVAASRTPHPYGTFTSHRVLDRADDAELARAVDEVEPDVVLDLAPLPRRVEGVERTVLVVCGGRAPQPGVTAVGTGAVLGPGDASGRSAACIRMVEGGGDVPVPDTYREPLSLVWVRDLGFACALACDPRRPVVGRSYSVGFDGLTLELLLSGIARALGKSVRLVPTPGAGAPYPPGIADLAPARADLGFEPSALEDALAETLTWYRVRR